MKIVISRIPFKRISRIQSQGLKEKTKKVYKLPNSKDKIGKNERGNKTTNHI
jgi:hypothetical protein